MPSFSAYGVWTSPAGFTLTIRRDGTYEFCDGGLCQSKDYGRVDDGYFILKGFFRLSPSRRFIELAEKQPPCDFGFCYMSAPEIPVTADDLEFFDSVSSKDAPDICGDKECTIVGNVEAMGGLLLKQSDG
jgi:hypothetical protein